mmetsp:Transcript_92564/g.239025  ORF Transcript_92564/g.239025 Transcript_92564/m.239025 type:complete len:202 (-) Transcript_92564:289-894(-)
MRSTTSGPAVMMLRLRIVAMMISLRAGSSLWASESATTVPRDSLFSAISARYNWSEFMFWFMSAANFSSTARYLSMMAHATSETSAGLVATKSRCTIADTCSAGTYPSKARSSCARRLAFDASPDTAVGLKVPLKGSIFCTAEGSSSCRLPNSSPAATMLPAPRVCWILPEAAAFTGMIIFIASSSTYGSPFLTEAPSSFR